MTALLALACIAVDGDTLKCQGERLRLLAIDTPDFTKSPPCRQKRPGYVCDDKLAAASKRALSRYIAGKRITWQVVSRDRYGRPVVIARADGVSLSCVMLRNGAVYVARFDRAGIVRAECGRR